MTIDTQEALRLLSDLNESVGRYAEAIRNDKRNGMTCAAAANVDACVDKLRALLSAKEGEDVEIRLFDGQWVNVVNHANCYAGWEPEAVAHHAVRMTEHYMAQNYITGFPTRLRDAEKENGNG